MTVTRDEAIALLEDMVRIDSVTPWLIAGGAGEGRVARYMQRWLNDIGLEVTLEEVEPDRPNVLAWLRGGLPGPTICLTAHSDTVGYASWSDRALHPVIEGDRTDGSEVLKLRFTAADQLPPTKLKAVLADHLAGFRAAFGGPAAEKEAG